MLLIILSALLLLVGGGEEDIVVTYLESVTYPAVARDAQVQGTITLVVEVSPEGNVVSARANSGDANLKSVAEENIRRWKFAHGTERKFSIKYEFSLEEPRTPYRSETRNYFELPTRVRVVTSFPARSD
jgi:TonB family protein